MTPSPPPGERGAALEARKERKERILRRIRAIPPGFVRTYGDIDRHAPRLVGRVLATSDAVLPWHRVVRSDGSVPMASLQIALLVEEGVPMHGDRVDLGQARLAANF